MSCEHTACFEAIGVVESRQAAQKDHGRGAGGRSERHRRHPVAGHQPYYPQYDGRSEAAVPAWVDRLMDGYF